MSKDKDLITKKFLKERERLSEEEVREASRQVFNNLQKLELYGDFKYIMAYMPIKGELDLATYYSSFRKDNIQISIPVVDHEDRAMSPALIEDGENLVERTMNILEPEHPQLIDPHVLDAIIIPGVAFDKKGSRIGFGYGYYDRFLKTTHALRIAIAYDFQIIDKVPIHELDVPMDYIITPKKTYHFPNNFHKWRFYGDGI